MSFIFHYVCGFPLVLLHPNLPFFFKSSSFVWSSIPLTVLNASIQVWAVKSMLGLIRRKGR